MEGHGKEKHRVGMCSECVPKLGDFSRRWLYECTYCERWFCKRHKNATLAKIPIFEARIKPPTWIDRAWDVVVLQEKEKENTHPCFQFTMVKIRMVESQREEWLHAFDRCLMPRQAQTVPDVFVADEQVFNYFSTDPPPPYMCPRCATKRTQMTAYRKESIHYLCLDCNFKWELQKQEKKKRHWWQR